jgi:hypothetical protein
MNDTLINTRHFWSGSQRWLLAMSKTMLSLLKRWRLHVYCCLLLNCSLCLRTTFVEAAWFLTIPPYEEECYLLRTPSNMKASMKLLTGDYELIHADDISADPLLVYVMENASDGSGKIVWRSTPGSWNGSFRVPIKKGKSYWMCLQNSSHAPDNAGEEPEHPDHLTRQIGFSYRVEPIVERLGPVLTREKRDEWMDHSAAVANELKTLVNHQDYMRMREADHRSLVEQTFSDVMTWTLAEASMVVFVAAGQVLYLRRFLEQKRYI